ncbi:MAG: NAD(P)H-dependent oxidoreductase [Pseudomonadota bacterium]
MRILAFAASNSRQSINKQLVVAAANLMKSEVHPPVEIEVVDLNDYDMPIYSIDLENASGVPNAAHSFYAKIGAADALLIAYAEHNGNYTAAFKSLFDWMSRIDQKVFQDKPMVIMATSPGTSGGANVLRTAETSAPFFGAEVRGTFSLPKFPESFDATSPNPLSPEKKSELREVLSALVNGEA